jgi:hypothetical protein
MRSPLRLAPACEAIPKDQTRERNGGHKASSRIGQARDRALRRQKAHGTGETLGYLACGLVLLTFGMRTMLAMRIAAIGSNLAFITYGLSLDLVPIWALHIALLPLNAFRLLELQRGAKRRPRRRSSPRVSPLACLGLGLDPR